MHSLRVLLACLFIYSFLRIAHAEQLGPKLDPVRGSEVSAEDILRLPSADDISSIADLWLVEVTNLQPTGAQSGTFDPVRLSAHGQSFTQWRFLIEGSDITDPATPGAPLIQLPTGMWKGLRFRSLWTASPQSEWTLKRPNTENSIQLSVHGSGYVGGSTWVPTGFMDREPAIRFGATPFRRGLRKGGDVSLGATYGAHTIFLSLIDNTYRFPTLADKGGQPLNDRARRFSGAVLSNFFKNTPMLFAIQSDFRKYAGAQYRFPTALTATERSQRLLFTISRNIQFNTLNPLKLRAAVGWAIDRRKATQKTSALVTDLQEEWFLLSRPIWPGRVQRAFVDATAEWNFADIQLKATARVWRSTNTLRPPGNIVASTYLRQNTADKGAYVTVFDKSTQQKLTGQTIRWQAERLFSIGKGALTLHSALDGSIVGSRATNARLSGLNMWSMAGGLLYERALGGGKFFSFLRYEPWRLTQNAASFVAPDGPTGKRYQWRDDGDLLPQEGEYTQNTLLNRTGNAWRRAAKGLNRPGSGQWGFGWHTPSFSNFEASLTGNVRLLFNRFTVGYDKDTANSFTKIGTGQDAVFYRDLSDPSVGQEFFILKNDRRVHPWVGTEMQLRTKADNSSPWFMSLAVSGYWSFAATPFGLFPDRNDTGIINEISADPNSRLRAYGRPDSDRSFGINLLVGSRLEAVHPVLHGFEWSALIRYRDGEPMSQFSVRDLPQGPTAVMDVARGDPIPRFTFHMTLDMKLRYRTKAGALVCNLYNVVGSGTEIAEDIRAGDTFRTSLEMVPHRTVSCGYELSMPL